jgi:hypothetical protein
MPFNIDTDVVETDKIKLYEDSNGTVILEDKSGGNQLELDDDVTLASVTSHLVAGGNPHATTLEQARSEDKQLSGSVDAGGNDVTNVGALDTEEADIGVNALTGNGSQPLISNESRTLFVDPASGSDDNDGSSDSPLATVQEAVDRVPLILRHSWTINVVNGSVPGEDVVVQGVGTVGGEQDSNGVGHATLAIQSDSSLADPASLSSITAVGCDGLQSFLIRGFEMTGASKVLDASAILCLGCQSVEVSDIRYSAEADTTGTRFFGGTTGKVTGTHEFGNDNRDNGLVSKRGSTMLVRNATVSGNLTNVVYNAVSGDMRISANTTTNATADTNRYAAGDGFIYDSSRNDFRAGVVRRRGARASQSSDQTIASGTTTQITLGSTVHDDASLVELANDRITADEFGRYQIKGLVTMNSPSSGTIIDVTIQVNGSTTLKNNDSSSGDRSQFIVNVEGTVNLSDGDNVTFHVKHDEGADLSTVSSSFNVYLAVEKLG